MHEIENISCIYHTILFFSLKRSQIEFYALLNNEDLQRKELQNITADIDYKDFMKIYWKCTSEPCSLLTIDAKHLEKIFYALIKVAWTAELKIHNDKIKSNQAQYDLDREAAKFLHYHLKKWISMTILFEKILFQE